VTVVVEVLEHPAYGAGDAVDLRQERLGDHQHAQAVGSVGSGGDPDDVARWGVHVSTVTVAA
jgi:hypothetical protein